MFSHLHPLIQGPHPGKAVKVKKESELWGPTDVSLNPLSGFIACEVGARVLNSLSLSTHL